MKQLLTLSQSEFDKIIEKRKSKVLIILVGMMLLGAGGLYFYVENNLNLTTISGSNFSVWILESLMGFILPFFAAMVIADSIAGESQVGTMANVYALPVTRQTMYVSKIIASLSYVAMIVGVIFVMTLMVGIVTTGLDILFSLGMILTTYLKAIAALGLVIACVGYLALWMKSSSMTLVVSTILFIVMNIFGLFIGTWDGLLPTTVIGSFDKIFTQNHMSLLVNMISYYIILIIIGIFKFQKKEV
ncbi:ABC transporter permease [Vallitalea pronyensis]|uniref:ABC transporter permease n=1 Tax=Vallitalea pronyensis TaxID=1348613 RepID=A0A8J8MG78_9FIRM|nr:ABC transporter permease [Vallitalea pronyensis]QUI20976.1 ABC transporter permease [Vallitalea pronyensis]